MRISVLIPAYNEQDRIGATLEGVLGLKSIDEIVVVDDGSADRTYEIAASYEGVSAYKLEQNSGKGYAVNFGLTKIKDADIIVFLDADVGSTSGEVQKLIEPIINGECDVTIAAFPPAAKKGGFGLVKRLARSGVKLFTGAELSATLSGQRAFKKEVLDIFDAIPSGYGVEVGMTIDILRKGFKVKEVPVYMTHNETGRDISGFKHRGKQFYHISVILLKKLFK